MRGHALMSTDITQFYMRTRTSSTSVTKKKGSSTAETRRRASSIAEPKKKPKKAQEKPVRSSKPKPKMSAEPPRIQRQQQAPKTELDFEIERLKAELQQEKQMKLVYFDILVSFCCFIILTCDVCDMVYSKLDTSVTL